jgi:hypothetical protein
MNEAIGLVHDTELLLLLLPDDSETVEDEMVFLSLSSCI